MTKIPLKGKLGIPLKGKLGSPLKKKYTYIYITTGKIYCEKVAEVRET
jgi:hypothetical protein